MRFKRLNLKFIELIVSIDDKLADRIKSFMLYQYVIRPILNKLSHFFSLQRRIRDNFTSAKNSNGNRQDVINAEIA